MSSSKSPQVLDHKCGPASVIDANLRIVSANSLFMEQFARTLDNLEYRPLADLLPSADLINAIRACHAEGAVTRAVEVAAATTGGRERIFLACVAPSGDNVHVTMVDVTDWKQEQENRSEQARFRSMGDLVAGVAHEINNPLAAIMGLAQLSLMQQLDQLVRRDIENILGQARRAAEVVGNLQAFAGIHKPRPETTDIVAAIQEVVRGKQRLLTELGTSIQVTTSGPVPLLNVDRRQIAQVFLNIVTNSHQSIAATGRPGAISIEVVHRDEKLIVTVADDGPGIPVEVLPRIFDPFFTTHSVGQGYGLGLSVCYRIVTEHGGEISAANSPAGGAVFTVVLPEPAHQDSTPQETGDTTPVLQGPRVLVIDDEPLITDFVSRALERYDCSVEVVGRGEQVLLRPDLAQFDLILMDVWMPGMDGVEVYVSLRDLPGEITRRVVIMTGDTASARTRDFIAQSGALVLSKPFGIAELTQVVEAVTGSKTR